MIEIALIEKGELFVCPFCKKEYQLQWTNHLERCFLNPVNVKLIARWYNGYVLENSFFGEYALDPPIYKLADFCKRENVTSPQWIMNYLEAEEFYEFISFILQHGILNKIISENDIKPEILYLLDSEMFLPKEKFLELNEKFSEFENALLQY